MLAGDGRPLMLARVAESLYWIARSRRAGRDRLAPARRSSHPRGPGGRARQRRRRAAGLGAAGRHHRRPRRFLASAPPRRRAQRPLVPDLQREQPEQHHRLRHPRPRERPHGAQPAAAPTSGSALNGAALELRRLAARADRARRRLRASARRCGGPRTWSRASSTRAMRHDEAWQFLRLGRYLERAEKSARLLEVKFHLLRATTRRSRAVDLHQWRALLSATPPPRRPTCTSTPPRSSPESIARFLMLDARFPRSVAYCLREVEDALVDADRLGAMAAERRRRCGSPHRPRPVAAPRRRPWGRRRRCGACWTAPGPLQRDRRRRSPRTPASICPVRAHAEEHSIPRLHAKHRTEMPLRRRGRRERQRGPPGALRPGASAWSAPASACSRTRSSRPTATRTATRCAGSSSPSRTSTLVVEAEAVVTTPARRPRRGGRRRRAFAGIDDPAYADRSPSSSRRSDRIRWTEPVDRVRPSPAPRRARRRGALALRAGGGGQRGDHLRAGRHRRRHAGRGGRPGRPRRVPGLGPPDDRDLPAAGASPPATSAAGSSCPGREEPGESHAWMELTSPARAGWSSTPPIRARRTSTTSAWRSAATTRDVPPLRGSYVGAPTEQMTVTVEVRQLP